MGGSISSENAFSGSVGFKSCLYTISSEELCPRNEQNSCNNMEKMLKESLPIENLEFSTSYSEEKKADDNDILPARNHPSLIEGLNILESGPVPVEIDECNTLIIQPHPFDVDVSIDLNKQASGLFHLHLSSDEDVDVTEVENTYLKEEKLSSVRMLLTTPSSRLLSAIKGSRSQNGNAMNGKMSVKWAADVYDPPVTSSSHTVKGRHRPHHHSHKHHPKSKKDYYAGSKHSRGKSSRGGSKEKNSHRESSRHNASSIPQISRKTAVNTCFEPKVEPLDEEVHIKESITNYGNSCYNEPLASLPFAVAKVS